MSLSLSEILLKIVDKVSNRWATEGELNEFKDAIAELGEDKPAPAGPFKRGLDDV